MKMETKNFHAKAPPLRDSADLLSKLYFCWTTGTVWLGFKRNLEQDDIAPAPSKDQAEYLGERISKLWEAERIKSKPSLFRVLLSMFGAQYLCIVIMACFQQCVLRALIPVLLGVLIRYLSGDYSDRVGYSVGALFIFITFLSSIMLHNSSFALDHMAMRIRVSVTSLIYKKTLRMSQSALAAAGVGKLTNIISNDVNRFDRSMTWTPYVFACPIQLIIVGSIMWAYMGPSCLSGIIFLVFIVPLQGLAGSWTGRFRAKIAVKTDARLRLMSEVLSGMLLVKMCTWEAPYQSKMEKARSAEIRVVRLKSILQAFNYSTFTVAPKIANFLTLLTFVLMGNELSTDQMFVTLSMYGIVTVTCGIYFPDGMIGMSELWVSVVRIQSVLQMDERPENSLVLSSPSARGQSTSSVGLQIQSLSSSWPNAGKRALNNISLNLAKGELVGIVGPVGSGKSTLLQAILGEVDLETGGVVIEGSVAYASQEACFFPGSIQDNILFGRAFEPAWYRTVIEACALLSDLAAFTHGDETLVGEKGANLSGGQKARISLARAIYSRAEIYLLDDPLSAVDVSVASHIMENVVLGLLRGKCTILVTHQTHYLTGATRVISLENGEIEKTGSYSEVCGQSASGSDERPISIDDIVLDTDTALTTPVQQLNGKVGGYGTFQKQVAVEEGRAAGAIPWGVYYDYARAGNSCFWLTFILLLFGVSQLFMNASDVWLKLWTDYETTGMNQTGRVVASSEDSYGDSSPTFIEVYGALVAVYLVFCYCRAISIFMALVDSAVALHSRLFAAMLRAPMRFFEVNPMGRILNRFSNDMGVLDEYLPQLFYISIGTLMQVLGNLVVIVMLSPFLMLATALLLTAYYFLRRLYITASPKIKRLEGMSRSPVFAQLANTMEAMAVIRAFGAQHMFLNKFHARQNTHSSNYYMYIAGARWYQSTAEVFTDIFTSIVLLAFLIFDKDPSALGLAISSALTLTMSVRVNMTISSETVNQMVSAERVMEYMDVEPEAPLRIPGTSLKRLWLERGDLRVDHLSVAYKDGPEILQDLTLRINDGEKVGIIGRTGAGKSSLIAALFRIVEPSRGQVHFGAVDICRIGLHDLRPQLSIIPQNPSLFSGSLRQTLDPFNQFTDQELLGALRDVQLEERLQQSPGQSLDLTVSEGGANFSHGEKQLLCLARTILRNSKVLILDEATANIDTRTDAIIQEALRNRFRDRTVLTVAHRLDTVMDSDRILVLEAGRIKEFDAPVTLLRNRDSLLCKLVDSTGAVNSEKLRRTALEAEAKRDLQKRDRTKFESKQE